MKTEGINLFQLEEKISVKEAIERVNLTEMIKMKYKFA